MVKRRSPTRRVRVLWAGGAVGGEDIFLGG